MEAIASRITSLTIVYSIVYSDADQRKHQSSASLAFVWGIHRWPVNSPHKWPVTRKMFPFDDVIIYGFWDKLVAGPSYACIKTFKLSLKRKKNISVPSEKHISYWFTAKSKGGCFENEIFALSHRHNLSLYGCNRLWNGFNHSYIAKFLLTVNSLLKMHTRIYPIYDVTA